MGLLTAVLFFATGSHTIATDQYPLRSGCETSDSVLRTLPKGSAVEIRFAMSGGSQTCYKISATVAGQTVEGWVFADGLTRLDIFDKARQDGATLETSRMADRQVGILAQSPQGQAPQGVLGTALQLLEAKQPAEALRVLEAAMKGSRRDPQLLALAGIAAYRADNTRRAVEYLDESLQSQPNPQLEQFKQRLENELRSDKSGEKLFGTRFVIRYDGTSVDNATAHSMVEALEEEYSRLSQRLGCRAEERLTTIVQTREAYLQTTGAAEWSGGQYDGAKIRIALLEPNGVGPRTRKVFQHELVHACLASMGTYPAWLHEGLAQYLSGDRLNTQERQLIHAMLREKHIPKLSDLAQDWSRMDSYHAQVAYKYSLEAAQTLFGEFENYGLNNILRNPSILARVTDEISKRIEN